MILVETPGTVGCLMQVRLLGVIEVEQLEEGKPLRNDRLIAVADTPVNKPQIQALDELAKSRLNELEQFFVNYNRLQGREFNPIARGGRQAAQRLLEAGILAY